MRPDHAHPRGGHGNLATSCGAPRAARPATNGATACERDRVREFQSWEGLTFDACARRQFFPIGTGTGGSTAEPTHRAAPNAFTLKGWTLWRVSTRRRLGGVRGALTAYPTPYRRQGTPAIPNPIFSAAPQTDQRTTDSKRSTLCFFCPRHHGAISSPTHPRRTPQDRDAHQRPTRLPKLAPHRARSRSARGGGVTR